MKPGLENKNTAIDTREDLDISWKSNSAVRKLLDVISCILANEYVCAVKENPSLFSYEKQGGCRLSVDMKPILFSDKGGAK